MHENIKSTEKWHKTINGCNNQGTAFGSIFRILQLNALVSEGGFTVTIQVHPTQSSCQVAANKPSLGSAPHWSAELVRSLYEYASLLEVAFHISFFVIKEKEEKGSQWNSKGIYKAFYSLALTMWQHQQYVWWNAERLFFCIHSLFKKTLIIDPFRAVFVSGLCRVSSHPHRLTVPLDPLHLHLGIDIPLFKHNNPLYISSQSFHFYLSIYLWERHFKT